MAISGYQAHGCGRQESVSYGRLGIGAGAMECTFGMEDFGARTWDFMAALTTASAMAASVMKADIGVTVLSFTTLQ
jgi:hypothetical protein